MNQSEPVGKRAGIHVVDDDAAVRRALSRLLRSAGFDATTYASAEDYLAAGNPDDCGCLLLDLQLPGADGLDLQRALSERGANVQIVFLTGHGDVPSTVRALKKGAFDFLEKPVDEGELISAIRHALARDAEERSRQSVVDEEGRRYRRLTPREQEVFAAVVSGRLNKQIAATLDISERTVKAHRAQAMRKMGARSLAELVQMAVRLGLLPTTES